MSENQTKVFISYAHESEEFKKLIFEFGQWLITNGKYKIEVVSDHIRGNRAPKEGWIIWMQRRIEEADIVLVVCTPKYKQRFERRDVEPTVGRGAIFEGAIITQTLYTAQLDNDKFHPIIPDDGSQENVPVLLQQYSNGLSFPSKNEEIVKCILNDNPAYVYETDTRLNIPESELESTILKEIIHHNHVEKTMLSKIQILVRAFLSLSDIQKIEIAQNLTAYKPEYNSLTPVERDKNIFKIIKEKDILGELWDSVNLIKPFNQNINPFKK